MPDQPANPEAQAGASYPPQARKGTTKAFFVAALLLVLVGGPIAVLVVRSLMHPSPGTNTTVLVQLKRNVLGLAANSPMSPTVLNVNGTQLAIQGKLLKMTEEWVILDVNGTETWIPRDNILLIEMSKK